MSLCRRHESRGKLGARTLAGEEKGEKRERKKLGVMNMVEIYDILERNCFHKA